MNESDPERQPGTTGFPAVVGLLALHCALRIWVWSRTLTLEDHDSIRYVRQIEAIAGWNTAVFPTLLNADFQPGFPGLAAPLALVGASGEFAGRLISFAASIAAFLILARLGSRWPRPALLCGLAVFALLPLGIGVSVAVLTEMTYVAIVCAVIALFFWREGPLRSRHGALLGALVGFAFLTRAEGILFVAALPALAALDSFLFWKEGRFVRDWLRWSACFALAFAVLAAPQVWKVSSELGQPAINGRQLWGAIMNQGESAGYGKKIYGLDYSPSLTNLEYLFSHPEQARVAGSSLEPKSFAITIAKNLKELWHESVGELINPLGFALLLMGLLWLADRRRYRDLLLSVAFLGVTLVAPVLYNVHARHLLPALPLATLLMGLGAFGLGQGWMRSRGAEQRVALRVASAAVLTWALLSAFPLQGVLFPRPYNHETDPVAIAEHAAIVRAKAPPGAPILASRKEYLSLATGAEAVPLPHASYPRLVEYLELREVDFLFLERHLVSHYPFVKEFQDPAPPEDFELLHRSIDRRGRPAELYRFRPIQRPGVSK